MQRSFYATAREYEFALLFSMATNNDKGVKNNAFIAFLIAPAIWISMFLIYLILVAILPQYKPYFIWIKDISILLGFLAAGYWFIRKLKAYSKEAYIESINHPIISYIGLSWEGINVNLYNKDSDRIPFFTWNSIKTIEVDYTRYLSTVFGSMPNDHKRISDITALNNKYADYEPYRTDCRVFYDKYTLVINRNYDMNMKTAYIQIPDSWINDGTFISLIQSIESRSGLKVTSFQREGEPINNLLQEKTL